jgi:hypothetical protein
MEFGGGGYNGWSWVGEWVKRGEGYSEWIWGRGLQGEGLQRYNGWISEGGRMVKKREGSNE